MNGSLSAERRRKTILSVVLAFICILYILPVLAVVVNSFKLNTYVKTETFALPTAESFAGWANYIKGVTNKLTNFLGNEESVVIIGNKKTSDELLEPDESFVDLSELYPDDPHISGKYFYYLKDTDFADRIGVSKADIPDDMYLALRRPRGLINASQEDMQETYDKDFLTFDRVIHDLSK